MTDLAKLVAAAQAGDRNAFAELYDRYARLVRAIGFDTVGNITVTEDIAQDVFLKVFRKLHQLRDPERFAPWLAGITRRTARDWRRRVRRDPVQFVPNELAAANNDHNERIAELRQAIRRLPEREGLAMHLFYLDDQPAETARQMLGLSSSGFYKLLERGRTRVAELMLASQETKR